MTTTDRVTAADLSWAAGWLLAYEGEGGTTEHSDPANDDEQQAICRRVAAWLDREVERRMIEKATDDVISKVKADTGRTVDRATARKAIRDNLREATTP
jgi:hypothetical protein